MSESDSDLSEYEDIRAYFRAAQWTELSSYEKASYRSAKSNYHAMQEAGLAPKPPNFMVTIPKKAPRKKAALNRKRKLVDSSEGRDANWTPEAEGKASSSQPRKKFVPPSRTKAPQSAKQPSQAPAAVVQCRPAAEQPTPESAAAAGEQREEKTPVPEDSEAGPAARYPKRAGSRKSYAGADGDALQDDDELYCDDCEQSWEGDCPVHGPLQVIEDTKVENADPERALHTVPPQLAVLESKIKGAGKGVWTRVAVPRRARFGPYEGDITPPNKESGYGWEIRRDGKPVHCVDALREATSNWMRYVNCPRNAAEANLHPYQHHGSLYYRTVCDIPANTELLVWYGNSYGKELGIDPKAFKAPPENPTALNGTFPCDVCGLCYVSPLLLSQHRRGGCKGEIRRRLAVAAAGGSTAQGPAAATASTTDAGRKHRCTTCGKEFAESGMLRRHERSHSGEKPYSCAICGAAFAKSSNLRDHERTHTGEKPYSCAICGAAFAQIAHLRRHERSHSGEKPFSCAICGAAFAESGILRRHERTHSGEKPYSCAICGKAFTRRSDMRSHKKIHGAAHEEPPRPRPAVEASAAAAPSGPARASEDTVSSSTAAAAGPRPPLAPLTCEPVQAVQEADVSSSCIGPAWKAAPPACPRPRKAAGRCGRRGKENKNPAPRL